MLLRRLVLGSIVALSFSFAAQAADPLKLDKDNSKITFVGKKPGDKHSGGFKEFTVDAKADMEDPSKSSINIEIVTDSLHTDADGLTSHLKNPDFFDVRKYPKIKFASTKIEVSGETEATIVGKMTMLDKEVEVKVPCKVEPGESGLTLVAKFKIDRTLWGLGSKFPADKIEKDVEIEATMKFKN